jgi:hypothetical protein
MLIGTGIHGYCDSEKFHHPLMGHLEVLLAYRR